MHKQDVTFLYINAGNSKILDLQDLMVVEFGAQSYDWERSIPLIHLTDFSVCGLFGKVAKALKQANEKAYSKDGFKNHLPLLF